MENMNSDYYESLTPSMKDALEARKELPEPLRSSILDRVQEFTNQRRYASGLKYILELLDDYPENKYVLMHATNLIHSGMSRSNTYEAASKSEQLTIQQLGDPRLDSIFYESSICGSSWVSMMHYLKTHSLSVTNPVGGWCPACEKIFCRKCMLKITTGIDTAHIECPECGGNLSALGSPPGRASRQGRRINLPIELVLFFREGVIPPDGEYMSSVLQKMIPDLFEQKPSPIIRPYPVPDWRSVKYLSMAIIARTNKAYFTDAYVIDEIEAIMDGEKIYVVRIFKKDKF